jgi:hypothetical protein
MYSIRYLLEQLNKLHQTSRKIFLKRRTDCHALTKVHTLLPQIRHAIQILTRTLPSNLLIHVLVKN